MAMASGGRRHGHGPRRYDRRSTRRDALAPASTPSTRCEDAARRLGVRLRVVVCHEDARIVDIVDGRVVELVLQRVAHGGRHRVLDALAVLAHDLCRNQISRCLAPDALLDLRTGRHDAHQKDRLDVLGVGRTI